MTATINVPPNPLLRGVRFGWQSAGIVGAVLEASNPTQTFVQ